jgi:N-methylhydantoinase A/oxoprolinase/acetone carboxylase beta subunit
VAEQLSIGVDVGGTNTDAVAVDATGVVRARTKTPTTPDPSEGIATAIAAVAGAGPVSRVALGTTHAVNAIVQRRGLRHVGVLRLGAPGTLAVPPLTGWPNQLRAAIASTVLVARGGVEIDGRAIPLDPDEIRRFGAELPADAGAIAVTGMFSPLDDEQERIAEALLAEVTDLPVTRGHETGGLGLLERENAVIVNAALGDVVDGVIDGLIAAVRRLGPDVPAFLTQNDGTVMLPSFARRLPVLTIGSGPSNSLRGAAALTGRTDVLVVDVGGTSTDVGALRQGFPRESSIGVTVGGVRTNFRMPDLVSVAVGGGTIIADGTLTSASVGAGLTSEALVFGGDTATLTDAAVAAGRAVIGTDPGRAGRDDLAPALARADELVADAIQRMRTSVEPIDVVVVGGGGILLATELPGARETVRPEHADVANAIGAALAPVAGEADVIADVGDDRPGAIERCLEDARARAVDAGADAAELETIWIDEVPLAYLDRPMSRLRAKVAGPPV